MPRIKVRRYGCDAHISVAGLRVPESLCPSHCARVYACIRGFNARKCVFSLHDGPRVTQCSRIPPEGTQWPVRPARWNKKQKHKAFIHSPPFLRLALSASFLFCFHLSLAYNSIALSTLSVHNNRWVIGGDAEVQGFLLRCANGKQRVSDNTVKKTMHQVFRSHLHS